jgi:predicted MFS family arabinose efflux permease
MSTDHSMSTGRTLLFAVAGGQLLVPLASDLADPARRGRVVGTIASGVLTGILVSRTISGLVADAFGWRAIYVLAAVVAVILAVLLRRATPELGARGGVGYPQLILSVFRAVRTHRTVQVTLLISSSVFAVFTMFWTALTFLLSSDPYDFSTSSIGLVGLVGLAGAVAAQRVGRLHARGLSVPVTGGANVLNQTRLFSVDPAARSRLNTAFVTSNFIGGAIGSALASVLWNAGGWTAVTIGAAVLTGFAATIWVVHRNRGLVVEPERA